MHTYVLERRLLRSRVRGVIEKNRPTLSYSPLSIRLIRSINYATRVNRDDSLLSLRHRFPTSREKRLDAVRFD